MNELISKQAAINTTFSMCCRWDGKDRDDLRNMMLTAFQELPTIDAVPVVRCADCKWWGLSEYNTFGIHVCKKFSGVRGKSDYCSRAERNE